MSEPMPGPGGEAIEPRPTTPPADAHDPSERGGPDLDSEGGRGADGPRPRRRRGSRGGRGRSRTATTASAATDGASDELNAVPGDDTGAPLSAGDRRPEDLPDRPIEGRPPADSAHRPKIGDSRPAP